MTRVPPTGGRRRPRALTAEPDRGSSLLGAVLVIPVMIILTMLVVQFAMYWHGRNVAAAVAQAGVQGAAGYRASAGDGRARALGYLGDVAPNLLQDPSITVDRGAATVTTEVHARIPSVVPFTRFEVRETVTGPIERFVAGSRP